VGLGDPTSNPFKDYGAELTNLAFTADFGAFYSTATPAFTAANPVPSILSSFYAIGGRFPYPIALAGGAGDLVVTELESAGATASLTANAVPEPTTLTLSGIGLVLVGLASWYRSKSSST